jgi:pimeloyl-ACP methyl ester carboxylesterase
MQSRKLEVGGGRAKIRIYEGGSGEPLLFLHGAGGLLPEDPFLAKLAQRYRVYAPCLPGYEDSEGEDQIRDMLGFALHGHDLIEALGLDGPILVGHSMGGMIAAEMAAIAPREVERLALLAPAGLWLDAHPIPDLFSLLPFELAPKLFHDVELGTKLLTQGMDFSNLEWLKGFMVTNARRMGMASKLLFPIPERGLVERLYRIRARTLLIWGASDALIPPVYGQHFAREIRRSELIQIQGAGHMLTLEQPDAVLAALSRF